MTPHWCWMVFHLVFVDTAGCPTLNIPHGFAVGPFNETVYYTCDESYKLSTKGWWNEAQCVNNTWSEISQCIGNERLKTASLSVNWHVHSAYCSFLFCCTVLVGVVLFGIAQHILYTFFLTSNSFSSKRDMFLSYCYHTDQPPQREVNVGKSRFQMQSRRKMNRNKPSRLFATKDTRLRSTAWPVRLESGILKGLSSKIFVHVSHRQLFSH